MRALPLLAAVATFGLTHPAQAREEKDAAAACVAHAKRLVTPLSEPRALTSVFLWDIVLRPYDRPYPFDAAAMARIVGERCAAGPGPRHGAWSFMRHFLSATGQADAALAVAQDRARTEPSSDAWNDVILARLRKGDDAGALAIARQGGAATGPDDALLDALYDDVQRDARGDGDPRAALALTLRAERRWRARVDAAPQTDDVLTLIKITNAVGFLQERVGDTRAATDAYGQAAALLQPLRAQPRDRYEEVSLETVMMQVLVSRVRTLATLGEREAALAEARAAVALVDGEVFAKPGSGLGGQIATGRWTSDPTSQPVADAFRQIGESLMKVDAPREAAFFFDVVVKTNAANAEARGRKPDGAAQIALAAARRKSGDLDGALATIDEGLALIDGIETDGGYGPMLATQARLERGEILLAQAKPAQACAEFRLGRAHYDQPPGLPLLDQALATLDARLAGDTCATRM
jgi:tetratricopeptide (TPR) repeat protein